MRKRKSDHELAEEIANRLANTPSGGRGPAADAQILLQHATNTGGGGLRQQYLEQAQHELAKLDPARYRSTIQRLQSQIMALQGRHGDTKVAHVARGELVVPTALQNPEVLWALRRAAAPYNIPLEMLSVGNAMNRINPNTGAPEFGIMDWISGSFNQGPSQADTENTTNVAEAAAQGATARAAAARIQASNVRKDYINNVEALGPFDNADREAFKAQMQQATPTEFLTKIRESRGDYLGPNPGSVGRANVTNPVVNQAARELGVAGRGLLGANVVLGLADTATSNNPARTGVANVGAIGGGLLGGALGAPAGPLGAFAGSGVGGIAGYKGGEATYDYLHDLWNSR